MSSKGGDAPGKPPVGSPLGDGLQVERTALAWQRTVLSVAVAALASIKVLFGALGYGAVAVGVVGIALAFLLRALAERRHRQVYRRLITGAADRSRLPGAAPLALCAAVVAVVGVVALGYVLSGAG